MLLPSSSRSSQQFEMVILLGRLVLVDGMKCSAQRYSTIRVIGLRAILILSVEEQEMFLKGLKAIRPNAAILTAVIPKPPKETNPHTPPTRTLPPTIMSLYHPHYADLSEEELELECKRVFEQELVVTQAEADYLEQSTRLQSRSLTWFSHRRGRITASKFGSVLHTSLFSPAPSLVDSLLKPSPKIHSPSLEWGVTNEPLAREEYRRIPQVHHSSFKVDVSGLVVNPTCSYVGVSPA